MNQAAEMKSLKHDMAEKEPSVSDLGKFDPDDFDAFEDAFLNLLAQSYGVLRVGSLHGMDSPLQWRRRVEQEDGDCKSQAQPVAL